MKITDIKEPKDIKSLTVKELDDLSLKMRSFLIESISETGGHLGSSLGALDLITALHYEFNSPEDKIIFDVGHQAYAHKILTGRSKEFKKLRQKDGISGFLKRDESIHDVWEAGHSSTSLSAAVGYAIKRDLDQDNNHVIAVVGDGSFTNGMIFEALNHIIELNLKVIIIINDNEMSISENVGFVDKILKNLEISSSYDHTKNIVRNGLDKIDHSRTISKLISASKTKLKNKINSSKTFFNLLGFKYFGPLDGHNYSELLATLKVAKTIKGPVIVHVKTEKGHGYAPALENKWHSVAPFDIETGIEKNQKIALTNADLISETLVELMDEDENITIVSPAMLKGSALEKLEKKFSSRVTDVGIAEEHGTTLVAALALAGKKPFLSIYSTFLQRSYDQVLHDIVRQKCGVVLGIDRAGLVGADGETHQGIYDIAFLGHIPGLVIAQGRNASEIKSLLKLGFESNCPYALRYSRGGVFSKEDIDQEYTNITIGTWEQMKAGSEIVIISYGEKINEIYEYYKANSKIEILNARFIKPLDAEKLREIKNKKIIVIEEHVRLGGLGSLILDFYNQQQIAVDLEIMAIGDHFVEQGTIDELRADEQIDLNALQKKVESLINE